MWELLALALLSAVYPTLVLVVVVALAARRPALVMGFFLMGGLIASVGVGVAIVLALQGTSLVSGSDPPADPIVYLVAGCLGLVFAGYLRGRPPAKHDGGEGRVSRLLNRSQSAGVAFTAGLLLNLMPGAWYLVALKDIAELNLSRTGAVLTIFAFCIVQYSLIEIPLLGFALAPERTAVLAHRFSDWLSANNRTVAVGVVAGVSCYLIVRGVVAIA